MLTNEGISDTIFQQDNASYHVSKKNSQLVRQSQMEYGFSVMNWPSNSSDMNLIENLWAHVKIELYKQHPDIATLRGPPHIIHAKLQE